MSSARPGMTVVLTVLTLLAFASNSLLCRAALAEGAIDAWSFTGLRLLAGALALAAFLRAPRGVEQGFSLVGAGTLFVYALAFSLAYVSLDAGVGALLLFAAVQVTMLSVGFVRGERWTAWGWLGFLAAVAGFLVQVLPGASAPDPGAALLMVAAGVAWGVYSLAGRGVVAPRVATAKNFLLAAPLGLGCLLVPVGQRSLDVEGVVLALVSGALTSGLGYVLWYAALRGHRATSAALVQLAVPVIAAAGGVAFLSEELGGRLLLAGPLTLGGIALAILWGQRPRRAVGSSAEA